MLYTLLLGDRSEKKGEMGSVQETKRDRGWIVRLIRDGTRCEAVSYPTDRLEGKADMVGLDIVEETACLGVSFRHVPYQCGYPIPTFDPSGKLDLSV